jgi:two-component system chemotaxis response regulator CheY
MPLNVLIVDDSDVIRSMIARTLALASLPLGELYEASNGSEALSVLDESWVDLVLADINMPVMDGVEMLERLRREPETADLPVIIVSTEGANDRIAELHAKGVSAWIRKPFTPEEIRDVVREVSSDLPLNAAESEMIDSVFSDVLERFAFMFADVARESDVLAPQGDLAAARITFSGAASGTLLLAAPMGLAAEMAANVLGLEPGDTSATLRGPDTLGEVLNMTCGHLATALEADGPTDLRPPTVSLIGSGEWAALTADPTARFFLVEDQPVILAASVRTGS